MAYKLTDFQDLYEAIAAELKLQLSDTTSLNRIKRVVNMVYLDEVSPRARWWWLQGHEVVRHKISYSSGTCAITPNTTTVTISVAPATTSGDSGSFKGWYFSVDGQNEIYRIASHTAEADTLELDTPYNGNLLTATAFKIFQENIPLPTDCRETVEIYYDHQATPLVGKGLQEFRKIQTSAPKTMGRPAYYCTYDFQDPTDETAETEADRYRVLKVWPAITQYTTILKVDYIKEVTALELDGDEPLMPVEDRIVLYYGALSILWSSIGRNPEESARNKALYEDKIARMMGKITDSMDKPRVEPDSSYIVAKRGPRIGQYSRKGLGPGGSGGSTYNSPTYLENVTINGATISANVTVNPGITVDGRDLSADGTALDTHIASIGDVHGAEGGIVGLDNAQVLTNKTINAADNTLTNISNSSIAAAAAIEVSKLAALTASRAIASDVSGVLTPSATTATELGYLSGVTSAVQTQLNTNATALSAHLSDTTDAHDASAISVTPTGNLAADDVQEALVELQGDINTNATAISDHLADTVDAHDASAISSIPSGNLAATDVQGALNELQTDVDTRATSSALSAHTSATSAHGVSGAIVGTTDTQVLTNKDIDGGTASNTSRITLPKAAKTTLDALTRKQGTILFDTTSNKPYFDDGTNLKVIGSGSGGATNFLTNPDAETGITSYATYKDAVQTRPVDGTGGAALYTTITTTSTNPLSGTNSFLISKSANNAQGEGVSTDFTIDLASKAKVLKVELDYIVESGTFAAGSSTTDSDLIVYLYDVTNSRLIEPSSFKFLSNSTTISDRFSGTFQTSSDSTSYRLIFHVASTSTASWALKVDNISVSPSQYVYGTPITDWTDAGTITFTGIPGTVTEKKSRKVGDSKEYRIRFTASGAATTNISVTLDSTIDTSKISAGSVVGNVRATDAGTANYIGIVQAASSTAVSVNTHAGADWDVNQPFTWGNTDSMTFEFSVPILGWSSSVQVSDGYDGRVIAASAYGTPTGTLNTSDNIIIWGAASVKLDKTTAYNSSTGLFTVQSAGEYEVIATPRFGFTASATKYVNTTITFSGSISESVTTTGRPPSDTIDIMPTASAIRTLRAGDTIGIYSNTNATSPTHGIGQMSIKKLSGSPTISASETVAALYTGGPPTGTLSAAWNTITYGTKVKDSHGAYSSGTYTIQVSGQYDISSQVAIQMDIVAGAIAGCGLSINNSALPIYQNQIRGQATTASGILMPQINLKSIPLKAGDTIKVVSYAGGASPTYLSDATINFFSITRSGGY